MSRNGSTQARRSWVRCPQVPRALRDVFAQHADIGALGAFADQVAARVAAELDQLQPADFDGACGALHFDALARQLVQRAAFALERRIHGRHLLDACRENPPSAASMRAASSGGNRLLLDHLALRHRRYPCERRAAP